MGEQHGREGESARIRQIVTPPLAALQFLTLAPPLVRRVFEPEELGRAVGYFPLVGALLGALLAGLDMVLARIFPTPVSTVLVIAAWVVFTGALHLDGFLDACDGLFGGHTPEWRLEIMRDERVGAFGLAGGVLLLLLKAAALASAPSQATSLLLAPTLARWAMVLAIVFFPYARPKGLGRAMKEHAGGRQVALATGIALVVAWFTGAWLGLAAMALAGITAWAGARFALARLPGLTGDLYGAIGETVEIAVLLLLAVGIQP
jgi:adenosylcobinamide-GDP ribazoletransferase